VTRPALPELRGGAEAAPAPLCVRYDVALLDLDGVVYLGPEPVPGAAAALSEAAAAGMRLAYVTNNASRRPEAVVAHLRSLGIAADSADVVTAAQAAARLLRGRLPAGARVLVLGAEGLIAAVQDVGLVAVATADAAPDAVVQGHSPATTYAELAEAALALRAGAVWVAANTDSTLPSPRGLLPGNGALVAALRTATDREPLVAGKPERALHQESVERTGARRPLVVGDRLDTDIAGAVRVGCDSLLVLTGVASAADLLTAPPGLRPSYVGHSVAALLEPGVALAGTPYPSDPSGSGWQVRVQQVPGGAELELHGSGTALQALRALCLTSWEVGVGVRVSAPSGDARRVLAELGLG